MIVLQEWWGLVPHIVDVADRLAREGFVVLAPDLYHGESTTEPDEAGKRMMALDLDRVARDIAGAARHLAGLGAVAGDRVGCVGFCMGGGLALWSGTISREITAAVGFYPAMPWAGLRPDWPAYAGKAVQLHLADGDGGSAAPAVQAARAGLDGAGAAVALHDYPGTQHAFFNDARPEVYDAGSAALAWSRTVSFLHDQLG